jgi:UDP-N-acetylmuramyl pentapeptide phosphotransferase/UDP-N-acetylglucosamine-1-phosphate transferase
MICSISLVAFGIYFYLVEEHVYSLLSFSLIGAMVAFLIFNWEPSKIFMGDTGALVLGMMLSILAIHFIDFNHSLPVENPLKFNSGISVVLCFIIIPLADTLRIFIIRILRKQSPFTPDKGHIHHNFVRLGLSHSTTTILLGVIQTFFIGLALSMQRLNDNYILFIIFLICLALSLFLDRLVKKKVARHEE